MSLASTSPVTFAGTGGVRLVFLATTSATRPAEAAYCFATLNTVPSETPNRSATTLRSGAGPSVSSNANKIRALVSILAGCAPVETNLFNSSRSASVRATTYSFGLGILIPSNEQYWNQSTIIPIKLEATRY